MQRPVIIDLDQTDDPRDVVHRTVEALVEGKLVVIPTETVYGLAASALSPEAVERIAEIKGRDTHHPFALAVRSADVVADFVPDLPPLGERLARRAFPGPVTLVFETNHPDSLAQRLPASVIPRVRPHNTLGFRVPDHPVALDILELLPGPLVLTSVNKSGDPPARSAEEVDAALGESIDIILDDGPCRYGEPSSVVKITADGRLEILRAGAVNEATLKRLSAVVILFVCTGNTCRSPMAEVLCRAKLSEKLGIPADKLDEHGVIVMSAGLSAFPGGAASPEAVEVLAERGLSLESHMSQQAGDALIRYCDRIYTMTRSHRQAIVHHWPEVETRVSVLAPDGSDICDPIGGSKDVYRQCADQIDQALEQRLGELLATIGQPT
ncbi:MAG: threonylcarbamoyl-AMP synthase [Planctomycetota bacterium]|nr:MAG: threonylcarbamoyl-AMP synthase [Planctomycetota bacterium]